MLAYANPVEHSLVNFSAFAGIIAKSAVQALLDEVHTTPKPGLVDRRNNGAHKDMDLEMFERSARALAPFFRDAAEVGISNDCCMPDLQRLGMIAEETMYRVTGGVNTHKGAIFSLGLFTAATGACLFRGGDLFERVSRLASAASPAPENTHGSSVKERYDKYKNSGARWAAMQGFPAAQLAYHLLAQEDESTADTLLHLIVVLDDTNLLYRGGIDGLLFAKKSAKEVLSLPKENREERILELDDQFIRRNLSPGGSADMLASGIYLRYTERLWKKPYDKK